MTSQFSSKRWGLKLKLAFFCTLVLLTVSIVSAQTVLNNVVYDDSVPEQTFLGGLIQGVEQNLLDIPPPTPVDQNFEVKLLSNTDYCLTDCETIYEIKSLYKGKRLDYGSNFNFLFKNKQDIDLKQNTQGLLNTQVFVNGTQTITKYCSRQKQYDCSQYEDNTSNVLNPKQTIFINKTCIEPENYACGTEPKETWEEIKNTDFLGLNKDDSFKLKIVGHKKPTASIDNVLNLNFENDNKKYEQWVWWNNNCGFKRKTEITNPSSNTIQNATITLILNSTNYNFTTGNGKNNIIRILNSTEDGVISHWLANYTNNSNGGSGIVDFNSNIDNWASNTNQTYYIYYNCSLSDTSDSTVLAKNNLLNLYTFDDVNQPQISNTGGVDLGVGNPSKRGILGNASAFNGGTSSFTVASGSQFGISFWFNSSADTGFVISQNPNAQTGRLQVKFTTTANVETYISNGAGADCILDLAKVANTNFHRFYFYRDSSAVTLSIDGTSTSSSSSACMNAPISPAGDTFTFYGPIIDHLATWNNTWGWDTLNLPNLTQTISNENSLIAANQPPQINLLQPDDKANFYLTNLKNFSWYIIDDFNTSLNCDLLINGSINKTFIGVLNNTNSTFENKLGISSVNYTWGVNCTDGTLRNQTLNRTFTITSAPIIFNQSMINTRVKGSNEQFFRQVNCTASSGNPITYSNNQTQLFNISSTTGRINDSPLSSEVGNYSVVIGCNDSLSVATSNFTYEIVGAPFTFSFLNNITNTSVYETTNQSFYINITYNTSVYNISPSSFFTHDITNNILLTQILSTQDTSIGYTDFNSTLFKANFIIPLTNTNNSNTLITFNIIMINGSNVNTFVYNDSHQMLFAYIISSVSGLKNVTEGQLINFNFSLNKQTSGVNFTNATIEFDAINYTASIVQDSSANTNYTTSVQLGFYNQSSHFAQVFAYLNLSYAGVITTRSLVGSPANTTISMIGVSNCSAGNLANATDNTLKINILDESNSATLSQATFLSTIIAYKTINYQRNFSVISTNNGSFNVCYRPVFDNLTASISAQYSNTSYGTRYYFNNLFNLINTTQTINLYLLQNATPGLTTITVSVVDQDDQVLVGKTVEVWSYNFGTGQFTFLTSRDTNFEGKTQFDLNILNTYYKFVVKSGQNVLSDTDKTLITTTNFVIRISSASSVIMSNLISLFNVPKTINWTDSSYRNITFNYTDPNNVIQKTCMRLVNASNESQVYFNDCMTGATGRLTFDTLAKKGIYTAYINATLNSDGNTYNWDPFNLYNVDASILGREGLMAAFFIVGVMFFAGLYNPAAAILLGLVGFVITSLLAFQGLTWTAGGGIMFLILVGIFLVLRLKT